MTTLTIKGMHCQSCVSLLTEVLEELPGVRSATVDLKTGSASIDHDPKKTPVAALKNAITAEGYEVTA